MKSSPHPDIDWDSVVRKLTAVAINKFRGHGLYHSDGSVLAGLGTSPSDLAYDALLEFFGTKTSNPPQSEDECFALCVTILGHRFIDAMRRHAHKLTDPISSDDVMNERENIAAVDDGLSEVEANILAEANYKFTNGEQELRDVIDAAALLSVSVPRVKRDDIASLLAITPAEVTKRNERLQYNRNAVKIKERHSSNAG